MVNNFQIDTDSFLIHQFSKIANSESCAIVLRGFVTPIALHAGLSLQGYEEAQGWNRVDLATCQAMKMITIMGDQYHLLMPDPLSSILLPDHARLTIQIWDNWLLQAPTTDAEPDDRPAPPPPAPSHAARSSHGPRPNASTVDALRRILDQQQQLSMGKRNSMIDKRSSKTPSTTWPTSSNACTIDGAEDNRQTKRRNPVKHGKAVSRNTAVLSSCPDEERTMLQTTTVLMRASDEDHAVFR
ncbi:hypothetical protein Salat_0832200 [Sesamum alatum]|uniref:Uncharacterized protein n=1 Tax=Sesamum alatum TaxID=300844 RepID=A0AAE1YI87_9LAMI|nr:hypothetical protein Salat_0832200 [Sesamum alatum]